jgi:tRNA dimethylallyltransferase
MPNDAQRIQRALEVWRITGRPLSRQQNRAPAGLPFALRAFAVAIERTGLHERIAKRFDALLQAGLLDEVRALRERYRLTDRTPSMRAVGYRQAWEHLEGQATFDEMRSRAIAATRQLAKRQMTWLRSFPEIEPVPAEPERMLHSFL